MKRRNRTDSAAGRTEITQGAISGAPKPPKGIKISKGVKPFWDLVTTAKAKRAWTDSDLVLAAEVARCMYRLELVSQELEENAAAPSIDVKAIEQRADMLAKRVKMLNTHLQIHPEATQGKSHKQVKQNEAHRDAVNMGNKKSKDDLLARPN